MFSQMEQMTAEREEELTVAKDSNTLLRELQTTSTVSAGKKTLTEEEWKKREEEWRKRTDVLMDMVLKLKMESTENPPPSKSGDKKVADWLETLPEPIDSDSCYDSMSEASSQADSGVETVIDHDFNEDIEKITPEKLSRGRLQAQLEGEGTYECELTGLIFEAKERVVVRYSGPIFNVHTVDKDASALKSIQLPHSQCLTGPENERAFGVLHFPGKQPTIENSGSHLKKQVSSLSPVGSIALDTQKEHNGAVLVYYDLWSSINTHIFRIYLALNRSWHEELELKKGRFIWVYKNHSCQLVEGKYRLISEPRAVIHPVDLTFTLAPTEFRGFFEAFYEEQPPFTFYLKASGTDVTVWSAMIHQGDLVEGITLKSKLPLLDQFQLGSSKSIMCAEEPQTAKTPEMKVTFVKNNYSILIQRITEVLHLADCLHEKGIFSNETYREIRAEKTKQSQIRILVDTVCRKGKKAMSEFHDALQKHDQWLFEDLAEHPGK